MNLWSRVLIHNHPARQRDPSHPIRLSVWLRAFDFLESVELKQFKCGGDMTMDTSNQICGQTVKGLDKN